MDSCDRRWRQLQRITAKNGRRTRRPPLCNFWNCAPEPTLVPAGVNLRRRMWQENSQSCRKIMQFRVVSKRILTGNIRNRQKSSASSLDVPGPSLANSAPGWQYVRMDDVPLGGGPRRGPEILQVGAYICDGGAMARRFPAILLMTLGIVVFVGWWRAASGRPRWV